jgi:hypothetical protein
MASVWLNSTNPIYSKSIQKRFNLIVLLKYKNIIVLAYLLAKKLLKDLEAKLAINPLKIKAQNLH